MINVLLGGRANALAIARSLKKPPQTVAVDFDRCGVCKYSGNVGRYILVEESDENILLVLEGLAQEDVLVLYPTDDFWVEFLCRNSGRLEDDRFLYFRNCKASAVVIDKLKLYEMLSAHVLTPKTALWSGEVDESLVVKPRRSFHGFSCLPKGADWERKKALSSRGVEFVSQQKIDAPLEKHFSICGICLNGKIQVSLTSVKLQEYPHPYGTATLTKYYRDSDVSPMLQSLAKKILSILDYQGIFELEFIVAGNALYFIEMNPRFWLQHGAACELGINFSTIYRDALLGKPLPSFSRLPADKEAFWVHEAVLMNILNRAGYLLPLLAKIVSRSHYSMALSSFKDWKPVLSYFVCKLRKVS